VKRGEIWTVSGGADDAGQPRSAVIVQDDRFDSTNSITICGFSTDRTDAPLFRLRIQPGERNGFLTECSLMVDKIATVPKSKLGNRLGQLDAEDMTRLNRATIVFLGLAGPTRARQE
jgi:mRNA interferase MazF